MQEVVCRKLQIIITCNTFLMVTNFAAVVRGRCSVQPIGTRFIAMGAAFDFLTFVVRVGHTYMIENAAGLILDNWAENRRNYSADSIEPMKKGGIEPC